MPSPVLVDVGDEVADGRADGEHCKAEEAEEGSDLTRGKRHAAMRR